jgi:hypothetical protein
MNSEVRINAVTVNHNTSPYCELMLRSLYGKHPQLNVKVTVMDNASTDDMSGLEAFAAEKHIPIKQSGYDAAATKLNSHGEILSRYVLDHTDCEYYLFLDSDVAFLAPNTINVMLQGLNNDQSAFGVGPLQSWDAKEEIPNELHELIYERRLHPCCALIRNTHLFRHIVEIIGLTGVKYCWSKRDDECPSECEDYVDTLELMTRVMKTHGQKHLILPPMILHFFSVSYDPQYMERKNRDCQAMLAEYRA